MKTGYQAPARSVAGMAMLICFAAGTFALDPAAAQGTADQRQACTGDALRLCNQFIPDAVTTGACLARMRASLTPECRVFFGGSKKIARRKVRRHHR
jgi:hypothetical protein